MVGSDALGVGFAEVASGFDAELAHDFVAGCHAYGEALSMIFGEEPAQAAREQGTQRLTIPFKTAASALFYSARVKQERRSFVLEGPTAPKTVSWGTRVDKKHPFGVLCVGYFLVL